jgi:hypothetical protein
MAKQNSKEIFYHVGLGKTGTTYLQYRVFPKFKGVYYIQRTKYKKSFDIIRKTNYPRYLVSNEFDRQYPVEIRRIAGAFPDAKIIMVLRRQDSWLASQYRRWVKNGYEYTFEQFIDLDNDGGEWKQKDAYFFPYIEMAEKLFSTKPLVLLYDDMRKDPISFFKRIADYVGAEFDPKEVSLKRVHTSYNEKQLLFRRKWNRYFSGQWPESNNKVLAFLQNIFYVKPVRYGTLYLAKILPGSMKPDEVLTPESHLKRIREFYKEDWEKCVAYSREQEKELKNHKSKR